jgi:uncharacterized protein (TIGR03032 family)
MAVLDLQVSELATDAGRSVVAPGGNPHRATREVRHEYTPNLPSILQGLNASLLVSTYQAGKVVGVGVADGELALSYHNFERAMGLAVRREVIAGGPRDSGISHAKVLAGVWDPGPSRITGLTEAGYKDPGRRKSMSPQVIAVGARAQIWFLNGAPELAPRIEPAGRHDACFVTRSSRFTGEIQGHEMAWSGEDLWIVNTAFSCLCTLHPEHSFEPRWRPSFVSALAPEDRCHLNGLAMKDGRPKYVTVLGESDLPHGWRPGKAKGGALIDVESSETVTRGFAMPHSPRVYEGQVWLLHSGEGRLIRIDPASGRHDDVAALPGYARGLAFAGPFAFIGLSKVRETSTFGGMPIAARREELKCGIGVIDLRTGRLAAHLEFASGIDEIFDVQVLPGARSPMLSGPYPTLDGGQPIWTVPSPKR